MIPPVPLAAATAVHIDNNLMVAELQPGDLHVIAGIHGRAMRGNGAIEHLRLQWLAHDDVETVLARRQRLDGFGKFAGDVTDQSEL